MKIQNRFLRLLGGIGITVLGAVGINTSSAPLHPAAAQVASDSGEQEACERALEENTIEALEAFLQQYPNGDSGCRASASIALSAFEPSQLKLPEDDTNPGRRNPEFGGGYGA